MPKKCAIFDLDGTLLYTLEDLYLSLNYSLEKLGYKKRTIDEVRSFVGNGIKKLIERAMPQDVSEDTVQKCLEIFVPYYQKNSQNNTKPYVGIIELLDDLKQKGCLIAINSNKIDSAVKDLANKYFKNYVQCAIGERPNCPKKPNEKGVMDILEILGSDVNNAVFIGDSLVDIQTAKNANIPCISVTWGYCAKNVLEENNKIIADNTAEVYDIISSLLNL